jgi:tight adherence protein B
LKRVLCALALAAVAVVGTGGPAFADALTIRSVDTTKFPTVVVSALFSGPTPNLADVTLRENGRLVQKFDAVPLGRTNTPVGVVLLIDTSGSMNQNGKLDAAKAAARQFVAQRQPNDRIAVVAFSSQPRILVNFTSDAALLNKGIDSLAATGETALFDGVRTGAGLFADHPDFQPDMVLLSDGKDTVSTSTFAQAEASAQGAHAAVFTVGLQGGDFDEGPLHALAADTGGQYFATTDPRTLSGLYAQVQQSIQNQYQISYVSGSQGAITIDLTVAGQRSTANASAGGVARGANAQPHVVDANAGPGFLAGTTGKLVIAVLVLLAAGLLAYGIILIAVRERSSLEAALQPYSGEGEADEEARGDVSFADTAIVQRAVAATARFAEQGGVLSRIESMLEQADLPLRAAEAFFFYLATVVVLTGLAGAVTRSLFGTAAVFIIVILLPFAVLQIMSGQRKRKFMSQLPDTLQLLAGSMRAGYSLMQGVDTVAQEVDDPMGRELRRVLAEARLGRVLEDSLEDMANRLGSADFEWAVMAIRIQREVGGNLAELLDTVSDTMTQRERLRLEIKALTAEGRFSGWILGIFPVAFAGILYLIQPDYMGVLFDEPIGIMAIIASVIGTFIGAVWLRKILQIEV